MDAELMTPSERIAKIWELLTNIGDVLIISRTQEMLDNALSLLDGLEPRKEVVITEKQRFNRVSPYFHCAECDVQITDNDRFCRGCGASIKWKLEATNG